jgi:signal transduction histidine kinase
MKAVNSVADAVYAEQVRTIFQQMPIAVGVNIVNSALTAAVLAPFATRPFPLPWFISVVLVTIGRGILWLCYRHTLVQPDTTRHWSRLAICGSLLSGLCWGVGGVILLPVLPALGQLFLIIVIGGMCAGAIVISAAHLPTLLAFVLSASLPVAGRLFAQGSMPDSALAAMIVVFAAALALGGRHFRQIFTETMQLRFERDEANLHLNEANLRLQAEMAEHRVTEAALHQAQKLEAIGHLTGGIAHDFNNLLSVVAMDAAWLHDRAVDDEPTRRRTSAILSVVDRGERLIQQLLAFSRCRMLRSEIIALQRRTGEIAELLARGLREDIGVTIDLPDDLWPVRVDLGEFELALLNIAVNARDAMPNGGAFRITARNTRCAGEAASGGLSGDFVAITLSDTGAGMPAEVRERAFEPYFTTKEAGLGSGLGLSQVYGFTTQSGGGVVIASEPDKGTTVTLLLPRASAAPTAPSSAPVDTAHAPGPARILLVEDDRDVAEATQRLLRDLGFETRWARNGKEALVLFAGDPPIDLVLSDVVMPGGVSGLDLARTIRERRPDLPILLGTGYSGYAAQVMSEGFALIEKPYRPAVLTAALRSALERRRSTA